ncbi:MAG: hypothetical protein ACREL7_02195 [Longimicrobiales bacterium]
MHRGSRVVHATILIVTVGTACGGADRRIVPGERIGPVSAQSSEAALVAELGASAVVSREIQIGEGFCTAGTVVFPETPDAIEVTWTDRSHVRPASASIQEPRSRFATESGVRIGTTLEQLAGLNGGPISFTGFGWDYGGTAHWEEPGSRDPVTPGSTAVTAPGSTESPRPGLDLRLAPDSVADARVRDDPRYTEILGEQPISSDHPLLREMGIRVEAITIRWADPAPQHQCSGL